MKGPDKSLLNASNRVEQKSPFKRYVFLWPGSLEVRGLKNKEGKSRSTSKNKI
jgi:hypothetical protein